jgi:hypothetical protein
LSLRRIVSLPRILGFATLATVLLGPAAASPAAFDFQVAPATVTLEGNFARTQLVVTAKVDTSAANERGSDLTHQATYVCSNPQIVTVTATGQLLAAGTGETTVTVTVAGVSHPIPVKVTGVVAEPAVGFTEHVLPVLSKAGCNAGACHASQYGKGGFKLSVFAFAPEQDHQAIVRDGVGRRVNFLEPGRSLLLLKPTLGVPHMGGKRLKAGSVDYRILERWLASGAPPPSATAPLVTKLQVVPDRRVGAVGFTQQLRVVASYTDGKQRDVTAWAKFDSTDESVLQVGADGLVRTVGRGQGAAMVRFEGQAELATMVVPYADKVDLAGWVNNNFIDRLAAAKFQQIGITPSPLCEDATFLRRAFLDVTGSLPTVEQAAAFLDSRDPDKRKKLIDRLLGLTGDPAQDIHNNEYAAYWSLKWSDLIRSNSAAIGEQGMWALHNWIKESFRENKPFDKFVRELITAKGSTYSNGPSNFYRIANNPQDLAETTAQLFLGVRLQCAKCHHHPYEKYSQADYYGFAAFFARVGSKGSQDFGLFGGESVIMIRADGEVGHPRTGKILPPTPLEGKPAAETLDRRQALATWLTARDNRFFARNVVNRYFAYLMGRGLVEPIDDLRATNPPSNVELMDALADDFAKSGFNVKHLLRTIMNSRLYQLSSESNGSNASDVRFYSHYQVKRLPAEPLLDAIDGAAGTQTKFQKVPLGTRAIELPDAQYENYFLKTFGKPRREAVCECERVSMPNLAQALHTLNGDVIEAKITSPGGRVARLLAAKKPHDEIVNELYLATLCRRPTAAERATCHKLLAETKDARVFYEDLLWSLVNSKHFLFVR